MIGSHNNLAYGDGEPEYTAMQEEAYAENSAGVKLPTRSEMYRAGVKPYRYQVCMMLMDTT
jgi:hypothetical protein